MDIIIDSFLVPGNISYSDGNYTLANGTLYQELPEWKITLEKFSQVFVGVTLILLMAAMGCTLTVREILLTLRRPYGVVIGALCQFIAMPLVTFGMAHAVQMPAVYAMGMLIIGCSPGGGLSNLLAYWVDGNVPLSICMTSVSTVLALGMMPLNLFIYGRSWSEGATAIPFTKIIITLISTVGPVIVGVFIKYKLPKVADIFAKVGSVLGMLIIVVNITIHTIITEWYYFMEWRVWMAGCVMPLIGTSTGYLLATIARLPTPSRRVVAFETGCQNTALAVAVIWMTFPKEVADDMLMFPFIFAVAFIVEMLAVVGLYKLLKNVCHVKFDVYVPPPVKVKSNYEFEGDENANEKEKVEMEPLTQV